MNPRRVTWIDLCKGFAIILVLLGHSYSTNNGLLIWLNSFHMPRFFMITGLLIGIRKIYERPIKKVFLDIYKDAMANLANTNFHFLISDGPTEFITCDSPAFIHKREDNKLIGLLPITPRILMTKGRNSDNESLYYVTHITDDAVVRYNKAIRDNAEEFVIHPY